MTSARKLSVNEIVTKDQVPLIPTHLGPFLDEFLPCSHLGHSIHVLMDGWEKKGVF